MTFMLRTSLYRMLPARLDKLLRCMLKETDVGSKTVNFWATRTQHFSMVKTVINCLKIVSSPEVPILFWFGNCCISGLYHNQQKGSYITAASTSKGKDFGFVFMDCNLQADEGVETVYLGRPWRPYAKTVFLNCFFGQTHL